MDLPGIEGLSRMSGAVLGDLRARLAASGFSPALLIEAERFVPGALREPRLPLLRWWLERRPEPGAVLARLFVYDDALPERVARDALGAGLLGELVEAGVVAVGADGAVTARFHLRPLEGDVWLLSDFLGAGGDAVMGPSSGTRFLTRLMSGTFTGSVLDLGCGAGSMALAAARRGARRAVGVDLNARAIAMARINARLNGLHADFEVGDGVAPVAAEKFDLVLAQPPFVMRPPDEQGITYLHGGSRGDELALAFVAAIPRVLAPGGRGLVLMESPELQGEGAPLTERLRAALGDAEASLLVLAAKAPSPAMQASAYASLEDPHFGPRYAATVRRYLDHIEALGVREVRGALVRLEGPAGGSDAAGTSVRYTLGLALSHADYDAAALDRFASGLALAGQPPDVLERVRLRIAPSARLVRQGDVTLAHVDAPGIGADLPLGDRELELLASIDAARDLGAAARALGDGSAAELDQVLGLARSALVHGALAPDAAR